MRHKKADAERDRLREQLASSVRDVKAVLETNHGLRAALERLLAELGELQLEGVREVAGNTNAAVLKLRIDEAHTALGGPT